MINLTWYFSLVLSSASAHRSPRQRSPQHSNLGIRSACIPPRRHRQASLVSALLYPSNNLSNLTPLIPWDKLPLGIIGSPRLLQRYRARTKRTKIYRAYDCSSYIPITPLTSVTLSISQ